MNVKPFEPGYRDVVYDRNTGEEHAYEVLKVTQRHPGGAPKKVEIFFQYEGPPVVILEPFIKEYRVQYLRAKDVAFPKFYPGAVVSSNKHGEAVVVEQLSKAPNARYKVEWLRGDGKVTEHAHSSLYTGEFAPEVKRRHRYGDER